jgi:hypothetical protein
LFSIIAFFIATALAAGAGAQEDPGNGSGNGSDNDSAERVDQSAISEPYSGTPPTETLRLQPLFRSHAPFVHVEFAGGLFDIHREVVSPRILAAVAGGYRFESFGLLGMAEFDHSWDFSQVTATLSMLKAGVGAEYLYVLGHARTSAIAGLTVLVDETALDDSGTVGWFVDVRPVSIRWGFGDEATLELTPVGLDVSVPVTGGIPLVLVSFLTRIGFEWSIQ